MYLAGKAFGEVTENIQFSLEHIDRGIHQIYATIVNNSQSCINIVSIEFNKITLQKDKDLLEVSFIC